MVVTIPETRLWNVSRGTTVLDKLMELGHVGDSGGSKLELDGFCARKTNAG